MSLSKFYAALFALGLSGTLMAQKVSIRIPDEVNKQFSNDFVNSSTIQWSKKEKADKKEKGEIYVADFIHQGQRKIVGYNSFGIKLFTETWVTPDQIPARISQVLGNDYRGYQINQVRHVENQTEVVFKIKIKKKNSRYEVEIDLNGKIRNKRRVFDDDDDEDEDNDDEDKDKFKKRENRKNNDDRRDDD